MNSYPILDNKLQILTDAELGDIVRPVRRSRVIDISNSPFVPARHLRAKLDYLLMAGELDGGLPILRHNILKGLIPAPDLEFALDNLEDEENTLCLMTIDASWTANTSDEETDVVRVDFGHFVDPVSAICRLAVRTSLILFRPLLLSIFTRPWTWYISALPNWVYDISACCVMGSTQVWYIRRLLSNS